MVFVQSTVQLLHKFSVRATNGPTKLLKVIRNPVTDHLPVGCRKLGTSFSAPNVVSPRDLVPSDEPVTVVVGAVAHGKVCIYIYN
jgi:rRNA small subunit pseudouridine methyltransferase Nep1